MESQTLFVTSLYGKPAHVLKDSFYLEVCWKNEPAFHAHILETWKEELAGTVHDSCFLSSLDWIKWLMLEEQMAKENEQPVCYKTHFT